MSNSDSKIVSNSTTGAGAPVVNDRNSLTIGNDGPIVLHDFHFP
jgi:catalase